MVAAAVIGGIGALGAAGVSAYGANAAAGKQANAEQSAISEQQGMFDVVQQNEQPFVQAGSGALPALNTSLTNLSNFTSPTTPGGPLSSILNLSGLNGPQNMNSTLQQTPGYQFTQNMGQLAVDNTLASQGLAGPGGPLATASANYATGLASNTWQSVLQGMISGYGAGTSGLQASTGALQNLVNTGANAAGNVASNATQTGSNIAGNIVGQGNAQAAGITSTAAAGNNAISGATNYGILAQLLNGNNSNTGAGLYTGNIGGTGGNLGGLYAHGGRPPVGRPIIVGEKGPEWFHPDRGLGRLVGRRGPEMLMIDRPGTIVPNNVLHRLLHADPRRNTHPGVHRLLQQMDTAHARRH